MPRLVLPSKDHYCYILRSLHPRHPNSTYIGYTIDPKRRLRQHNGEICGGAKTTQSKRPWEMVAFISGFPDETSALQLEWCLHHPRKALRGRMHNSNQTKVVGVNRRSRDLMEILQKDKWCRNSHPSIMFNITVHWLQSGYRLPYHLTNCTEVFD